MIRPGRYVRRPAARPRWSAARGPGRGADDAPTTAPRGRARRSAGAAAVAGGPGRARLNAAGLGGQELLPGRARAAGCGVDPSSVQDLPHRGAGDWVAEFDEFALHAPVTPGRIVRRDADHELADRGCYGRPSGTPAGVVPFACDQSPVPGEQRCRGYGEHLAPAAPGISRDSAESHSRSASW